MTFSPPLFVDLRPRHETARRNLRSPDNSPITAMEKATHRVISPISPLSTGKKKHKTDFRHVGKKGYLEGKKRLCGTRITRESCLLLEKLSKVTIAWRFFFFLPLFLNRVNSGRIKKCATLPPPLLLTPRKRPPGEPEEEEGREKRENS